MYVVLPLHPYLPPPSLPPPSPFLLSLFPSLSPPLHLPLSPSPSLPLSPFPPPLSLCIVMCTSLRMV